MCFNFHHFRTNLILGSEKISLKVKNFEVVNSTICAIFTLCYCKNLAAGMGAEVIFPPKNFILKYFQRLVRFQLLLDQDKFLGKV